MDSSRNVEEQQLAELVSRFVAEVQRSGVELPTSRSAEQVRAMSFATMRADPALWEAFNRGWEYRDNQVTRALRAPSPRQREPRDTVRTVRVAARFPPTTGPQTAQPPTPATGRPAPATGPPTSATGRPAPAIGPQAPANRAGLPSITTPTTTTTTEPATTTAATTRPQNAAQRRSAKRRREYTAKKLEQRRASQRAPPQTTSGPPEQQKPQQVSPRSPCLFPLPDPPRPFTTAELREMFRAVRTQPMETEGPASSEVVPATTTPQGQPAVMGTATQSPSENSVLDEPMAVTPEVEEVEEDFPSFYSCTPATSPRQE